MANQIQQANLCSFLSACEFIANNAHKFPPNTLISVRMFSVTFEKETQLTMVYLQTTQDKAYQERAPPHTHILLTIQEFIS